MENKQVLKLAQTIFAQMVAKHHELDLGAHEMNPEHLQIVAAVAFTAADNFSHVSKRYLRGERGEDLLKPEEFIRWQHTLPPTNLAPNSRCVLRKVVLKDWEEYLADTTDGQRERRIKAQNEKWKVVAKAGDILNLGILDSKGERFRVWTRAAILDTFMAFMDGETGDITVDTAFTERARVHNLDVLALCMALHFLRDGA